MIKPLRKVVAACYHLHTYVGSVFDYRFMNNQVPTPPSVDHLKWQEYLYDLGNKEGMRVLEVGSREVTGSSKARARFAKAQYVGFDYYPGANVDVVGDAHKLASYFKSTDQFDIIYSSACLEHFAMPWVVAAEMAKLAKIGGLIFVETHFAFSSHERPWHFFHFTDMGLRALFPEALGIECLESGMSNPLVGRFSNAAAPYLRKRAIPGMFCHSEFLGRKVREVDDFDWKGAGLNSIVGETKYPAPADNGNLAPT